MPKQLIFVGVASSAYTIRKLQDRYGRQVPGVLPQQNFDFNLISSLSIYENVVAISERPIRSFRSFGDRVFIPKDATEHPDKQLEIYYPGLVNITIIKQIFYSFYIFFKLLRISNRESHILLGYISPYTFFPAYIAKLLFKCRLSVIVPDVPKYMYGYSSQKLIKKCIVGLVSFLDRLIQPHFDTYIFLTKHMAALINTKSKPSIVMEGFCSEYLLDYDSNHTSKKSNAIMYAGSLHKKFGIDNLLDAFDIIHKSDKNIQLWLFGEGDYSKQIIKRAEKNKSIRYFGSMPKDKVIDYEHHARLLINPRPINDEYTKYSFPSKTLEYMASGTPLLTTCLAGIPEEYYDYVYLINDGSRIGIADSILSILSKNDLELNKYGESALGFCRKNKTASAQAKRIWQFLGKKYEPTKVSDGRAVMGVNINSTFRIPLRVISAAAAIIKQNKLISILELYLTITLVMYVTGPFQYKHENLFMLIIFVVLYQMMFVLGFLAKQKNIKKKENNSDIPQLVKPLVNYKHADILLSVINFINCCLIITSVIVSLRISNPISFIKLVYSSFLDPGSAYNLSVGLGTLYSVGSVWLTRIIAILSPITFSAYITGLYYFNRTKTYTRVSTVLVALVVVIQTVLTGQNIGIFTTLLTLATVIILKITSHTNKKVSVNKRRITKSPVLIIVAVAALVFICYFSTSTLGRMKPDGPINNFANTKVDQNNWALRYLPDQLRNTVIMANLYSASGYNAMDIALSMKYRPTYGLGNGFFSLNIAKLFSGNGSLYYETYQYRMRREWDPTLNWHTAYVWFANDITFIGVIGLMYLLGRLFAVVREYSKRGYIFAIAAFPLLIEMVIFFPCNNLIFGNPITCVETVGLVGLLAFVVFFSKRRVVYV